MSIKSSARLKKRRSGEPWVSNNRVLAGNSSKRTATVGRNPNFDTDETKLLIHLWGDPKLQRTLITTHKKHVVICQLAAKMEEYGYHRSPEEITTRIKNLKCFYNRLKKEMDNGLTSEPTWKHFGEMDAIMTRPIFSVRPNEVPAPSLKYQIEQAREERQERRKKNQEKGGDISESDDDDDDDDMLVASLVAKHKGSKITTNTLTKNDSDDGIIPDVEIDMDICDETFTALTTAANSKRRKMSKSTSMLDNEEADVDVDNAEADIKDEPGGEDAISLKGERFSEALKEKKNQSHEPLHKEVTSGLIIPKEEPIDVDADSDSNDKDIPGVRALMPTLADILQLSKSNLTLKANGNVCIPVSSISSISPLASKSSSNVTVNNTNTTTTMAQQGKISLVPTNFLMQPKPVPTPPTSTIHSGKQSQIHMLQKGQFPSRILLSGAQANNGPANMISTGPGGMKLLLLNPEQASNSTLAGKNNIASSTSSLSKSTMLPIGTTFKPLQIQQQQISQPQISTQKTETNDFPKRKHLEKHCDDTVMTKREATSLRILLRQLLNAQNESNEIQHNRLSLERERLNWEKALTERLFTILPSISNLQPPRSPPQPSSVGNARVQPTKLPSQQQQFISAQVSSNARRINPPKLVFTTTLPATNSTTLQQLIQPTSNLTSSQPKVVDRVAQNIRPVSPAKSIEICTQINDINLVTPKEEQCED